MKESIVYIDDILDAIIHIRSYVIGMSYQDFDRDEAIQDAVVRRLEIIGEAVKHLPASLKKSHAEIPWKQIAGMRDILIHEYAGVSVHTIWNTVTEHLQPLEDVMRMMKKEL